jgi:hypothetical protein
MYRNSLAESQQLFLKILGAEKALKIAALRTPWAAT